MLDKLRVSCVGPLQCDGLHSTVYKERLRALKQARNPQHRLRKRGSSQVSSETNRAPTSQASGLAGRYATALFELAESAGKLDTIAADLKALKAMVRDNADLARVLTSQIASRKDKISAMTMLCTKAAFDELTSNFVGVVAKNRRLFALPNMIDAFLHLLSHSRGEITAKVISAKSLSKTQLSAISEVLKKTVGTKVSVKPLIDEDLLGGMIVKVGSRMVDTSLKTKLQRLHLSMKGIG